MFSGDIETAAASNKHYINSERASWKKRAQRIRCEVTRWLNNFVGSRGRSSAEQSGNTGCTRRMLLLRLSRPRSQAPPPPRPTADTCGARLPFTPGLRQTSHPPREETPMDTQSPRAVGNPSLGLGPIPMGIFLADLFARAPASPPPLGLHLRIADSIPYQCISEGAIGPEDWHWATAGHAPLLGALRGTVNTLSLSVYLATRNSSRALCGAPTKWAGTSARFAARLWDLSNRGIAQRGRKVRHIWELRWHGENRAIANPKQDASHHQCGLCGHPQCGLAHTICECPHLTHARDGAHTL